QSAIRNLQSLLRWIDADELTFASFFFKLYNAGHHRKQRVVRAAPDVRAGLKFSASLAYQNCSSEHALAAESLHAQPLGIRIAPVARTAYTFLVCHKPLWNSGVRSQNKQGSQREAPPLPF